MQQQPSSVSPPPKRGFNLPFLSTRSGGSPPFFARVYSRSLRPIVIVCGIIGAIWTSIWAYGAFQDLYGDKENLPSFVTFDTALGAMYAAAAVTQGYAVVAAITSRRLLVRIHTYTSILGALVVTAAEIMRSVLHFQFKDELITQCSVESSSESISTGSGFWGATTSQPLSVGDATSWCTAAWSRTTFSDLAWLFVATILAWLFASIAFGFYHQILDPSSIRQPRITYVNSQQPDIPLHPYPPHPYQGQPYNPSMMGGMMPDYVPPYDPHKPPGYGSYGFGSEENVVPPDEKAASASREAVNEGVEPHPPTTPAAPAPAAPAPDLNPFTRPGADTNV